MRCEAGRAEVHDRNRGALSLEKDSSEQEVTVRNAVRSAVVAVLAFVVVAMPSVVLADGRVALVVGNSTYAHIGRLPNPDSDARDMAVALRRLGFEVTTEFDADRMELTEALRAFTRQSAGADVSLVFYAGHGIEMDGVDYLVPVDARLERDVDVRFETVTVDDLLVSTAGASLRLVILDACRNNPLARSMQRTAAIRSVSGGSFAGLNEDLLGDETLVAYAAAAGTTAADGRGRNSPYTSALLAHLEEPLELSALFRRVRAQVLEATNGEQRPHEYASLLREHYLQGAAGPGTVVVAAGGSADMRAQQEMVFWQSISNSADPADFQAYLEEFPNGAFARLARNRVAVLAADGGDPPTAERPQPGVSSPPPVDSTGPVAGSGFRDCDDCPEMAVVPAGAFRMGCVSGDGCQNNEHPVHDVEVASFALSKYEVTRGQFAAFVAATAYVARGCYVYAWEVRSFARDRWRWETDQQASWEAPGFEQQAIEPVVCVSWEDAKAYVRWLSRETGRDYRLPSEAEWEYAARAGTTTPFYWGARVNEHCSHGNGTDRTAERTFRSRVYAFSSSDCTDGVARTAAVGSYSPNAFGLYDMAGNVHELVEDCWHDNYSGAPRDGSAWTSGGDCRRRVGRGGSWNWRVEDLRSADRGRLHAGFRSSTYGFRVARTLD